MKSLRMFALILAMGAFPPALMKAHGQQEVDPDHFDQAPAAKASVSPSKGQTSHHATAANHQSHRHLAAASKHSGRKPNHRQVQA